MWRVDRNQLESYLERLHEELVDRFGELWAESQSEMLGDAVDLHDDYGIWWSYIPHFVDTPGYVYAYAYGNLLALSVYRRYEEEGDEFVSSYLELLKAGGSMPPQELGAIVGVDLSDPGFWSSGLDLPEQTYEEALQQVWIDAVEIPAGERVILSLQLPKEFVIVFEPVTHSAHFLDIQGEPTRERQQFSIVFNKLHAPTGTTVMRPGPLRLSLEPQPTASSTRTPTAFMPTSA